MREFRTVSGIVGRRTTLRYLALGAGAALLAACSSTAAGRREETVRGTRAMAFAAFVRGTWKVESTPPGGDRYTGTATISEGTWSIDWSGQGTVSGTWSLQGDRLALLVPESSNDPDDLTDAAATNVPASVSESVSLVLPWEPPGAADSGDGEKLQVEYDKSARTVRIRHVEPSGSTTEHVCTRT